jgi:hypothetical protein
LNQIRVLIAFVRISRPEKASQPVLSAAWNHMHVKMWDALADAVIHRNESSVRFHGGFNRARQELYVFEVRFNLIEGQISQGFAVFLWNYQAMTGKNRTMIKKSDRVFVFKDNPGRDFTADNFTEQAGRLSHRFVVAAMPLDVRKAFGLPGFLRLSQLLRG